MSLAQGLIERVMDAAWSDDNADMSGKTVTVWMNDGKKTVAIPIWMESPSIADVKNHVRKLACAGGPCWPIHLPPLKGGQSYYVGCHSGDDNTVRWMASITMPDYDA